ncbi:MAG TPA: hypothetical protein VF718_01090 [Allosphingosinicella sp.]|jgi:hypothetical protein
MTGYNFAIDLLASNGSGGLIQAYSGTLTLDDGAAPAVNGVLTLSDLQAPIPFSGTLAAAPDIQGLLFTATGQGGRAMAELSLSYGSDNIVFAGSYLGGLINLLDPRQQEWLYYIVQGMAPEAPRAGAVGSGSGRARRSAPSGKAPASRPAKPAGRKG